MGDVRIAIPSKGRLRESVLDLLSHAGYSKREFDRMNASAHIEDIEFIEMRPSDAAAWLAEGRSTRPSSRPIRRSNVRWKRGRRSISALPGPTSSSPAGRMRHSRRWQTCPGRPSPHIFRIGPSVGSPKSESTCMWSTWVDRSRESVRSAWPTRSSIYARPAVRSLAIGCACSPRANRARQRSPGRPRFR